MVAKLKLGSLSCRLSGTTARRRWPNGASMRSCARAVRAGAYGLGADIVAAPQVLDAVDIPVIAAGDFHDGRALPPRSPGADGIAMGTLTHRRLKVPDEVKQAAWRRR